MPGGWDGKPKVEETEGNGVWGVREASGGFCLLRSRAEDKVGTRYLLAFCA